MLILASVDLEPMTKLNTGLAFTKQKKDKENEWIYCVCLGSEHHGIKLMLIPSTKWICNSAVICISCIIQLLDKCTFPRAEKNIFIHFITKNDCEMFRLNNAYDAYNYILLVVCFRP